MKERIFICIAALALFVGGSFGLSLFAAEDPNNPGTIIVCDQTYIGRPHAACWENNKNGNYPPCIINGSPSSVCTISIN